MYQFALNILNDLKTEFVFTVCKYIPICLTCFSFFPHFFFRTNKNEHLHFARICPIFSPWNPIWNHFVHFGWCLYPGLKLKSAFFFAELFIFFAPPGHLKVGKIACQLSWSFFGAEVATTATPKKDEFGLVDNFSSCYSTSASSFLVHVWLSRFTWLRHISHWYHGIAPVANDRCL